jgi:hypothetical protein
MKVRVFWWANVGYQVRGHDDMTVESPNDVENIMDGIASAKEDANEELMPNFAKTYPDADHCINFGIREIRILEAKPEGKPEGNRQ